MIHDKAERVKYIGEVLERSRDDRSQFDCFIKELEDAKTLKETYDKKYDKFCDIYLVNLIDEYVSGNDDKEIMLVAYGLLQGYENKNVGERHEEYTRKAYGFNKKIKKNWSKPDDSLRDKENRIIRDSEKGRRKGLAHKLVDEASSHDNNLLNFADIVIQKLSEKLPDGDLTKYEFPVPMYLQREKTMNNVENEVNSDYDACNAVDAMTESMNKIIDEITDDSNIAESFSVDNSDNDVDPSNENRNEPKESEELEKLEESKKFEYLEESEINNKKENDPKLKKQKKKFKRNKKDKGNSYKFNFHFGHKIKNTGNMPKKSFSDKKKKYKQVVIGIIVIFMCVMLFFMSEGIFVENFLISVKEALSSLANTAEGQENMNIMPDNFQTGAGALPKNDSAVSIESVEDGEYIIVTEDGKLTIIIKDGTYRIVVENYGHSDLKISPEENKMELYLSDKAQPD